MTTTQLTNEIVETYLRVEDALLANIAKRFSVSDTVTPDSVGAWRVEKLEELGGLRQENIKILAKQTGKTEAEITELIRQSGFERIEVDEIIYREAIKDGVLEAVLPAKASKEINKILTEAAKEATKATNLINSTAVQSANKAFLDIVNQAYLQTSLGVTDYQTAIKSACMKLADNGITGIDYVTEDGRKIRYHLDTAIRRNIVSTSARAAADSQLARADQYGVDLVEVTSYAGARPEHAEWQGQIYSRSGRTKGYKNFSVTGYGTVEGLGGANCGHTFYPFIPGVSERVNFPVNEDENNKKYNESQEQRKLEREIREQKRRAIVAEQNGDAEALKKAQIKLKEKEAEAKAFAKRTGRTNRANRQQVDGFGKSEAQKAVQTAKKAPVKSGKPFTFSERLKETENSIRGDKIETGFILNEKGETLLKKSTGQATQISMTDTELEMFRGNIFTHNHPSDYAFSPPDIWLFHSYGAKEIRAVTTKGAYYMRPTSASGSYVPRGTGKNELKTYKKVENEFNSYANQCRDVIDPLYISGKLTNKEAAQMLTEMQWEIFAKNWGFDFGFEAIL